MLKLKKVTKSSIRLGYPAGKEVSIETEKNWKKFFLKYGQDLVEIDFDSDKFEVKMNRSIFETKLNHPQKPWTVLKSGGSGEDTALFITKKGLVAAQESSDVIEVEDGEDLDEDMIGENGTVVYFVRNKDHRKIISLDNLKEVKISGLQISNGEMSLEGEKSLEENFQGVVRPVYDKDGSVVNFLLNDSLFSVEGEKSDIKFDRRSIVKKIFVNQQRFFIITSHGLSVFKKNGEDLNLEFDCPQFSAMQGWTSKYLDRVFLVQTGKDDGPEALVGTGPKGIELLKLSKECASYSFVDNEEVRDLVALDARYDNNNVLEVLGTYDGFLYKIELTLHDIPEKTFSEPPQKARSQPEIIDGFKASEKFKITAFLNHSKSIRWMRDSFDEAPFKNIVNKATGQLQFSFALIDLSDRMGVPIKLMTYYDEMFMNHETIGALGRGLVLGKDCIWVDRHSNVLEDQHEYYLVKDTMKFRLVEDFSQRSNTKKVFYINGYNKVRLEYDLDNQTWEAANGKYKYLYGGPNGETQFEKKVENWFGTLDFGVTAETKLFPIQWSLQKIQHERNAEIQLVFKYISPSDKKQMFNIEEINDNKGTKISFFYETRKQSDLAINLMKGFKIETPYFEQTIIINYEQKNQDFFLHSITQDGDPEPILSFERNSINSITSVSLPSRTKVEFAYESQKLKLDKFMQSWDRLAELFTGPGYSLQITKYSSEKDLKVCLKDGSGWNKLVGEKCFRIQHPTANKIEIYQPSLKPDYFVITVTYKLDELKNDTISAMNVFNKVDKSWTLDLNEHGRTTPKINETISSTFYDDHFLYVLDNKLHLELWQPEERKWKLLQTPIEKPNAISFINRGAVLTNLDHLLVRWDPRNDVIKIDSLSSAEIQVDGHESFFKYITVKGKGSEEYQSNLRDFFNNHSIVFWNNLLAIRTVQVNALGKLSIGMFLYLFGPNYEVKQRQFISWVAEKLEDFELSIPVTDPDKYPIRSDLYFFKFQNINGKYELKYIKATDSDNKTITPSSGMQAQIEHMESGLMLPLDFEKYVMHVNNEGIIIGNKIVFFDGKQFQTKDVDREELKLNKIDLKIGRLATLKKASQKENVKLCRQSFDECINLGTNRLHNVTVRYPYYVVSQIKEDLKVTNLKSFEQLDFKNEIAHATTSALVLVTTDAKDKTVKVRPVATIKNSSSQKTVILVKNQRAVSASEPYEVKYGYEDPVLQGDEVRFENTYVYPGKKFGYFQYNMNSLRNVPSVRVFGADREEVDPEYVKHMDELAKEQDKQKQPVQSDPERVLLDASEHFAMVNTSPYSKRFNVVDFVGFEDYEVMEGWTIGGKAVKGAKEIVRDGFSGTGRNYLRLDANKDLKKMFKQVMYNDYFITSAWVRTAEQIELNSTVDWFQIKVNNIVSNGVLKQVVDNWLYIEAVTKSFEVPSTFQEENLVDVEVTISPKAELHVDHIRISPLSFNFEAKIYDIRSAQVIEYLRVNGKVSHYLYDKYSRRIAEIGEDGLVKYFASYSKLHSTKSPSTELSEGVFGSRIQIRPAEGFVETFSPYSIEKRWDITGVTEAQSTLGVLKFSGKLTLRKNLSAQPLAIRIVREINDGDLEVLLSSESIKIQSNTIVVDGVSTPIEQASELIILSTLKFRTVWNNGHIIYEKLIDKQELKDETIVLSLIGSDTIVRDLLVMDEVELFVSYLNRASNPVQEIMLQDSGTIQIRQHVYDQLDRRIATTFWTTVPVEKLGNKRILQYQLEFIKNDNLNIESSFLSVGTMTGLVDENNEIYRGYPYSQEEYYNNPLTIRRRVGQPGEQYSLKKGTFHEYFFNSSVSFIQLHYPRSEGFTKEQENKPNGLMQVTVFNQRNNKVAEFTRPKTFQDILTTYIYNDNGDQVQMLPPNYYTDKYKDNRIQMAPEKNEVVSPWATTTVYDKKTNLTTSRTTPDGGRVDYLYNEHNQLRYQLHYDENAKVDKIAYFNYNIFGRICETGILEAGSINLDSIKMSLTTNEALGDNKNVIYFDYGETGENSALRGRMHRIVKINNHIKFNEEQIFDVEGNLLRKSYINSDTNQQLSLEYIRGNDKIKEIYYPHLIDDEQLVLKYEYNLKGEVTKISRINSTINTISYLPIADIDHNAEGSVTRINHLYGDHKFYQTYLYAPPGYMVKIENEFLTETIYYDDKGYGFKFTGDGNILRTEFKAIWHEKCNKNLIPLNAWAFVNDAIDLNVAELCFNALLQRGYIDQDGRPAKTFYPDLELEMPIKCLINWKHLSGRMLGKGFPEKYGHSYAYGGHGELEAAKTFIGDEGEQLLEPIKIESFLKDSDKQQKLKDINLARDIEDLFTTDNLSIGTLQTLMYRVVFHLKLGATHSSNLCRVWFQTKAEQQYCISNFEKLIIQTKDNFKYKDLLSDNPALETSILKYLNGTLLVVIGKSPGDVESLSIDANGNHQLFYTGFKRFQLTYKPFKNQIDQIMEGFQKTPKIITHDSEGNIVKALHKNIESLEYDPLTQRVSRIIMTDGRVVELGYDYQGERILKRVRNDIGQTVSELYYIRDNKGQPMAEFRKDYPKPDDPNMVVQTTTAYIHGPLGLVGFFRNNKYYNVLLDHEGSTRLVIHRGKVVAAYDYLPYGQLIRKFGTDPEAHIAYRYTGQEYDEETDLYNYHARMYDPDIGRFFQIDPAEQYPSAYKYAGNSPVSQVDPDGQFAFLIVLAIAALVGAYLGAATANNSWNPANWDWSDKKTWLGLFVGAIVGAFAVYGGVGAFGYFAALTGSMAAGVLSVGAIAVVGAYLGAAAASYDWNPANWDWTSPAVWNGLFSGAASAISLPTGAVGVYRTFYSLVSVVTKIIYAVSITAGFVLLLYVGGALANDFNFNMAEWDWKNPKTWFGMLETASAITIAGGGAIKHGAAKVHHVVTPAKTKLSWYRFYTVPRESYTIKYVGKHQRPYYTSYKNGQRVFAQYLSGMPDLPTVGTISRAFVKDDRMFAQAVALGFLIYGKYQKYENVFETKYALQNESIDTSLERNKRSYDYATSSSNTVQNCISYLYNLFYATVTPVVNMSSPTTLNETLISIHKPIYNSPSKNMTAYCYGDPNQPNRVYCSQPTATINVFAHQAEFDPNFFGKATFSHCVPVTWYDRPAVTCSSEQSTFLYVTHVEQLRVFDMIDGWLLLARVLPAAVRNIKSGITYLRNIFEQTDVMPVKNHKVSKQRLIKKLSDFRKVLKNEHSGRNHWIQPLLNDLEEDIMEFCNGKDSSEKVFQLLQERLEAIADDFWEDLGISVLSTTLPDPVLSNEFQNSNSISECSRNNIFTHFNNKPTLGWNAALKLLQFIGK
ncbi:uncharacterized protein LOC129756517 [Uranotaenia lowii]|uniref:uncharacterized protein LOC129756517 n=1 Tax=Uranotaenia lowii TaxID=190385 RepID=UPI00247A7FE4|nr:uncharacterized protein LOC129756517 [Uranotaenia lowii]